VIENFIKKASILLWLICRKTLNKGDTFMYSSRGYHPLLMFDGLTGDLIKAELRTGNLW
jgi:hypothetical protein